jgi:hypothetical protein
MLAAAGLLLVAVMVLALVLGPCPSLELMSSLCLQQARAPTATLIALKHEQAVWLESLCMDQKHIY